MRHALIGGCIGILLGILGAAVTWNRNLGPRWYPVALIILALPQSWVGARLFLRRMGRARIVESQSIRG